MQQKNFLLFIVLAITILVGWTWLQHQLWPPKPPNPTPPPTPEAGETWPWPGLPASAQSTIVARLVATPSANPAGVADAVRLVAAVGVTEEDVKRPVLVTDWNRLPPSRRNLLADLSTALAAAVPDVVVSLAVQVAVAPVHAPPAEAEPETVVLGGPDYYLKAVLTTRGGGVRSLTLQKFQEANREGQPVYITGPDGKKQEAPLQLVPDNPFVPSFLLYHYPQAKDEEPVTTLGETLWKLEGSNGTPEGQEVRFSARVPGYDHLTITRVYSLKPREYHIGLSLEIKDDRPGQNAAAEQTFRYQLAGAHGLPIEGEWYTTTYRNSIIGMVDSSNNLWRTLEDSRRISYRQGGDRVPEGGRQGFLQYAGVATQYFAAMVVVDDKQAEPDKGGVDPKSILAWARPTLESEEKRARLDHIALSKGVITVTLVNTPGQTVLQLLPRAQDQLEQLNLKVGDEIVVTVCEVESGRYAATHLRRGRAPHPFLDDLTVRVVSEPVELKPGEVKVHRYLLYHGPVKVRLLGQFTGDKAVHPDLVQRYADTLHLRTLTDYHSPGPFGWFAQKTRLTDLFILCTSFMHWLLNLLLLVVRNEGLSIVLMTVIVRGVMFPISRKQAQVSMRMQELAPELKKVQDKYKNDPQARTAAVMELYRKHGVNPLGGCLPLLLQMPIFLGLYYALQESIRFRLAPFLWIENLAAPDMLLRWGEGIPWIGDPDNLGGMFYLGPYFNLLPVLAVVLMIVQQKLMMPPPTDEQQAMQQKMMKYMMVFIGVMFYKVAAGLCIYFIASSVWGLAERKLLPRKKPTAPTEPPGGGGGSGPSGGSKGPGGRGKGRGPKKPQEDKHFQKVRDWWSEVLKQAKKK